VSSDPYQPAEFEACSAETAAPEVAPGDEVPASSRGSRLSTILLLLLVLAATILPFIPALRYGFVFDDDVVVVDTVGIRNWQRPVDFFWNSVWRLRNSAIPLNYNYYRPIFFSWLRVNAELFRLHAWWWHLSTITIHLLVTGLVFFLLRRHLRNAWAAAIGTLVFGLHPVHIESVAWISGVTDPLATVGVLGGMLLWMRRMERPRASLLAGSLACYTFALFAKETAIVLPIIIFGYIMMGIGANETAPLNWSSRLRTAIREMAPFAGITLFYFAVRFLVLHSFRAGSGAWLPPTQVLLTAPSVLLFYLRHLVWPLGLSLFYDFSPVTSVWSARFLLPAMVLLAAGAGALVWRRKLGQPVSAAMLWVLVPLLPVLDIGLFYRDDFLHDRYLYLPSIGLALVCGAGAQVLIEEKPGPARRRWLLAGCTILLCGMAASTAIQSVPWQDNLTLYSHAAQHSTNTMARVNLASEYAIRGRLEDAKKILEPVVRERPDFWLANFNMGYVEYELRDLDTAEQYLRRAIAIDPREADAYTYLGLVFFRENRLEDAATELSAAIARNSQGEGYHFALGIVLMRQGHTEAGKTELRRELKNHPDNGLIQMEVASLTGDRSPTKNATATTQP
jgi:Tfp pilus assembly protein PilF